MVILVTLTDSIGMIVGAEGYINDIGHSRLQEEVYIR